MTSKQIIMALVMRSTPFWSPSDTIKRPMTMATVIQKIMRPGFESISPKPAAIWSGVPMRNLGSVTIL